MISYIQEDNGLNYWLFIRITDATRQWNSNIKVLKGKKCEHRILYLVETSFKSESEMTFSDKRKLKISCEQISQ